MDEHARQQKKLMASMLFKEEEKAVKEWHKLRGAVRAMQMTGSKKSKWRRVRAKSVIKSAGPASAPTSPAQAADGNAPAAPPPSPGDATTPPQPQLPGQATLGRFAPGTLRLARHAVEEAEGQGGQAEEEEGGDAGGCGYRRGA